ncbi:hypothetical protein GW17_00057536 [Ensete ventricosum]|nr:hypothetical protein GW17_00057536 [Ensete ventricosum]
MHRVDAITNSPGVRRELAEGIRSLPGWRKGVRQKKTETHRKIVEGSRKACRDYNQMMGQDQAWASGRGSDDVVGSHRSSLGDSPKGSGSSLGTRREITERRPEDLPQVYRRLPD